jgi:3-phenylpropionate/trans-cinnamate dioxygenase ferredoxin reductase component
VMLAQRAGLEVDDGVVCDSKLETSAEGIFAAGDCCSYESVVHGRRLRVEHWDVALQQGRHVGKAMLGSEEPYRAIPYFFSDFSDWTGLEYVGPARDWDEVVFRGERDDGEFSAWYLKDGKVGGALAVGRSEDLIDARALIETGADLSERRAELADQSSEPKSLGA